MTVRGLTPEEWTTYHQQVLHALTTRGQGAKGVRTHAAGLEYTSLMSSFLMQNISGAQSLLALYEAMGVEWFPVTVGYAVARTMFEVDVTAHYIAQKPQERASQYILFEHVLNKLAMEACRRHRKSDDPSWREAMEIEWCAKWAGREQDVNARYVKVAPSFTGRKGRLFQNGSGKTIRQLAVEVDHEEAYDTFYAGLSSFIHADVNMANRFLRLRPDGPSWTQRAVQHDVGGVLHDASSFLTCFLKLFGSQFGVWDDTAVDACWDT